MYGEIGGSAIAVVGWLPNVPQPPLVPLLVISIAWASATLWVFWASRRLANRASSVRNAALLEWLGRAHFVLAFAAALFAAFLALVLAARLLARPG